MRVKFLLLLFLPILGLLAYMQFNKNSIPEETCIQRTSCSSLTYNQDEEKLLSLLAPLDLDSIETILLSRDRQDALSLLSFLNTQANYKQSCTENNISLVKSILKLSNKEDLDYYLLTADPLCNSTLKAAFLLSDLVTDKTRSEFLSQLCTNDTDTRSCIDTIGLVSYLSDSSPKTAQENCESGFSNFIKNPETSHEGFVNGCYMGYVRASFEYGFWELEMTLQERFDRLCQGTGGYAYTTCSGNITRYHLSKSNDEKEYLENFKTVRLYCDKLNDPDTCGPYIAYSTVDYLAKLNITDISSISKYFKSACIGSNSKSCMLNFVAWYSELGTWDNPELYKPYYLTPLCKSLSAEWSYDCLKALEDNKILHEEREKLRHD